VRVTFGSRRAGEEVEGVADEGRRVLGAVLRAMVADERVVDEVIAAARTSPEVARLPEAENRRHVAVLLAAGLASFEDPGPEVPDENPVAALLGADRAEQGVPLAALLHGVQAGRQKAWEIGVARARAAGVPDRELLDALLRFDRYAGAMERHVVHGYHTAQLELARTARDARTQVLRRLLHGGSGGPPPAAEVRQAGLDPAARLHCVLSAVTDPVRARALERELDVTGALFGLVDGRFAGLTPRSPAGRGAARDAAGGPLLLVSPAVPLDDVPAVHRLCAQALAAADAHGLTGVRPLTGLAGETALAAQPALAALLTGELLGALDPADGFHRDLARTALTYLDLGHRLDLTAAALHVHPNTARHRLLRLAQLTGAPDAFDDPGVLPTLRWWWALHTWLDAARP
jgi:hypothetical protein